MRFHAVQLPDGTWATAPVTKLDTCTDADHPHPALEVRDDRPAPSPTPARPRYQAPDPQLDLFATQGES